MKKLTIPQGLILARFLMAPLMIFIAWRQMPFASWAIVILIVAGFVTDIFDGIIARQKGESSTALRRLDSQTDMIFWVATGLALWLVHPHLISANKVAIGFIFLMEASCYVVSLLKFGRETCTHAWLSKLWGISLVIAFVAMFLTGKVAFPFYLSLVIGVVSHTDRILITLILPRWTHDIPSSYHAWLIRKGIAFKRYKFLNG